MSGIWHFKEKLQKWKRIPPSEIPLFGKPLRKNQELLGVIGELGKIGNYQDSNFSLFLPRITDREKSGMIGSEFWRSVLAIIDHVFAPAEHCRSVTSQWAIAAQRVLHKSKHSCHLASLIVASSFGSCPRPCHPLMLWECVSSLASLL
jgi:hypothetical protein